MPASPEQSKIAAFLTLACALLLLGLSGAGLFGGSGAPPASVNTAPPTIAAPLRDFDALFATKPFAALLAKHPRDVFATDHFNPPQPPPKTDPGPKTPKARTVELTYLGMLGGALGEPTVFVRADKETLRLKAGDAVVDDWRVAETSRESLVVTNNAATNRLVFRKTLKLEVPIR